MVTARSSWEARRKRSSRVNGRIEVADMKIARRIENLQPYLFVAINKKIAEKRAKGEDIVSFAIADPDIPTPPHVIEKLCQAARGPANHRYPDSAGCSR